MVNALAATLVPLQLLSCYYPLTSQAFLAAQSRSLSHTNKSHGTASRRRLKSRRWPLPPSSTWGGPIDDHYKVRRAPTWAGGLCKCASDERGDGFTRTPPTSARRAPQARLRRARGRLRKHASGEREEEAPLANAGSAPQAPPMSACRRSFANTGKTLPGRYRRAREGGVRP
jgi:hypothetical protein